MDTVLGLPMLTYLEEPLLMLSEAHRVLRPGGVLLLEFTQMAQLHDEPHDYFRFTRFGAESLAQARGVRDRRGDSDREPGGPRRHGGGRRP